MPPQLPGYGAPIPFATGREASHQRVLAAQLAMEEQLRAEQAQQKKIFWLAGLLALAWWASRRG